MNQVRAGPSIRLRSVRESDLETFLQHEHDPENVRRSRFRPRDREHFMAHWRTRVLGDPGVRARSVTVDGELAGSVVAWTAADGRRFLGYVFGRAWWGRGIGTKAVEAFLRSERVRPLHADPHVGNTPSWRLLERLRFERAQQSADDEHVLYVLR